MIKYNMRFLKRTFNVLIVMLVLTLYGSGTVYAQSQDQKIIPRDTSFTPYMAWVQRKNNYPEAKIVKPQLPEGVCAENNIVYATLSNTPYGKRDLHLDLFHPSESNKGPFPALILIHGGGWRSGNKLMQVPIAQQIATRGYVTASVEYRLSPEALYPAAVNDIKAAIRFLRENAKKYNIDRKSVV